jgi:hypothetical protein
LNTFYNNKFLLLKVSSFEITISDKVQRRLATIPDSDEHFEKKNRRPDQTTKPENILPCPATHPRNNVLYTHISQQV